MSTISVFRKGSRDGFVGNITRSIQNKRKNKDNITVGKVSINGKLVKTENFTVTLSKTDIDKIWKGKRR